MQLANRSCGCLLGLPAERRQPLRAITCNSAAAARRASHFAPSSMHGVSRRSPSRASTEALPGGFEHLLADSALPILKICGLSAVGAYCAQQGMIDRQARRTLSNLAVNVFTPALMISKLGAHIDLQHALDLWPIGANAIICHVVGLMLGLAHTSLLNTPPHLRKIIQASTSISNVGNLPLVMVMSFVRNPNLPFNTASEAELAVSYVMVGWFFATMIQMPLGHFLLHKEPSESDATHSIVHAVHKQPEYQPLVVSAAMAPSGHATATTATAATCRATNGSSVDLKLQLELMWQLQIHGGSAATAAVAGVGSDSSSRRASLTSSSSSSLSSAAAEGLKAMDATVGSASSASSKAAADVGSPTGALNLVVPGARSYLGGHSRCSFSSSSNGSKSGLFSGLLAGRMTAEQRNWWQQLQKDLQPLLQGVLSPPLVAGLVAIGIGSNPFLKDAMFTPGGSLSLLGDCCDMLGQPLIPVLLLVLGANLAKGPGQAQLPWQSVAAVIATRLLLLPAVGCVAVMTAQHTGLIHMEDPLTMIVMMVAWSTPTAILVHSLASIHHNGEDEVSALLFWEYLAAVLTLPLCSATYLYLVGCCMSYVA